MEFEKVLVNRVSTRQYNDKMPDEKLIQKVIDAAFLAPIVRMHKLHLSVVTNKDVMELAQDAADKIFQAPDAIIFRRNFFTMSDKTKIVEGLQVIVTDLAQQADGHEIQSRIFASLGFNKLADKYAEHASEERDYVKKCVDRILDLGCEVKIGAKKELPVCNDALEFVKYDLQVSKDGLAWLAELVECAKGDLSTFDILSAYYKDEEDDMYWGEQQLELIKLIGKENWYTSLM